MKILILMSHFYPSENSGGPISTIHNVLANFGSEFDISVCCLNHDLNSLKKFDMETYKWYDYKNSKIMYITDKDYNFRFLSGLISKFDVVYCCGVWWKTSLILGKIAKKQKEKRIVIAPMGSFCNGALAIKKMKKKVFLTYCKIFKVFNRIIWSATSSEEECDIKREFGKSANIVIAEDSVTFEDAILSRSNKKRNELNVCFISRISPKKNLDFCFEILKLISNDKKINFNFYGYVEDVNYFNKIMSMTHEMPKNVSVSYLGELSKSEVVKTFSRYDLFLFPTKSENFGHVIYEALKSSCIPLISDQTPWKLDIFKKYDLVHNLDNKNAFADMINNFANMSNDEINLIKKDCYLYAKAKYIDSLANSGYRKIFNYEKN